MKKKSTKPARLSRIEVCITKLDLTVVAGIKPACHCKGLASRLLIMVITVALVIGFSTKAIPMLMTECCVDCHVVHMWEDQAKRKKASVKAYASAIRSAGKSYTEDLEKLVEKSALEKETCEGCHSDGNSHAFTKSGLNTVPIVRNAEEPENPLAGGNFYYNSGKSHFKKAGGSCTSCHKDVRHHGDSGYRFLGPDIKGIGDPMYEHGEGHNIYQSGDQYCISCHPDFCGSENQRSSTGWIRHPTNTLLPMNGEYAGYEVYRKDVPVSYPDPKNPERSTARVMCMSCHRPHGTPNLYLLRWDYKTMMAGNGDNSTGCFACHATKDTGE